MGYRGPETPSGQRLFQKAANCVRETKLHLTYCLPCFIDLHIPANQPTTPSPRACARSRIGGDERIPVKELI